MMELMIIVLNRIEYLESLLTELALAGVKGATILDSTGMASTLGNHEELPFFGSLRKILDPDREESKTIFSVVKPEQLPVVRDVVEKVTGGLDKPNTGILFSIPVNFVEGLGE